MKKITEEPEYAEELKKSFKQPVSFQGTEEAIATLTKTRDDFMQFKDEMRKAK
jgi:HPt (histidine-containing phosphotransfer) domain-containing protein